MVLCRRRCKIRRKFQVTEKKDLISSLPDDLLGQILSFLPTKYAVATSILSSRWRNLHQLSTNLDFDDSLSSNPQVHLKTPNRNATFTNFVSKALVQCKMSRISRFRLKCRNRVEDSVISAWVNTAITLENVTELELSIEFRAPYFLRLTHSTCQNLVVLKLDANFVLRVPKLTIFPCLKVLHFKDVVFPGDSSVLFPSNGEFRLDGLNGILMGCPLLEELVIDGCNWYESDLVFCNPLLRKLTFNVGLGGVLDQINDSSINFNLPSLVYLEYSQSLAEHYVIRNLGSVVDAHFEICFNDDEFAVPQELCDMVLALIVGVVNCKSLYLSHQCLAALISGAFELPVFKNLTRLTLCQGFGVSWNYVLLYFLNSSPCLEVLTLVQEPEGWNLSGDLDKLEGWNVSDVSGDLDKELLLYYDPVPSCVSSCLKVVNLEDFSGFRMEMDLVKYFLEKAKCLEQMVIQWSTGKKRTGKKRILNLPKASKSCSISFK